MIVSSLIMAALLSVCTILDQATVNALVRLYAEDADASTFLCGRNDCETATVMERTNSKCEAAGVDVAVCFIEPKIKARNFYIGVLTKSEDAGPVPQFLFFGSGINLAESSHGGVRDVRGREIAEGGAVIDYVFCWNGRHYTACGSESSSESVR